MKCEKCGKAEAEVLYPEFDGRRLWICRNCLTVKTIAKDSPGSFMVKTTNK